MQCLYCQEYLYKLKTNCCNSNIQIICKECKEEIIELPCCNNSTLPLCYICNNKILVDENTNYEHYCDICDKNICINCKYYEHYVKECKWCEKYSICSNNLQCNQCYTTHCNICGYRNNHKEWKYHNNKPICSDCFTTIVKK